MRKRNFTRQVGLILAEETYKQVVEETDRKEVTISEWIREAIEMRLESEIKINSKNRFPVKRNLGNEKNQIRTE
jgi:hypothetical protein